MYLHGLCKLELVTAAYAAWQAAAATKTHTGTAENYMYFTLIADHAQSGWFRYNQTINLHFLPT